jgi:hypothetical protein
MMTRGARRPFAAARQLETGGNDRPRLDRRLGRAISHGPVEAAELDALKGCAAADANHRPVDAANPSMWAREEIVADRQLIEGELTALVGDRAGERDPEHRDHRSRQHRARFIHDRPGDGAAQRARLESCGRLERGRTPALGVRRKRHQQNRRYADERHRCVAGQAFHGSCLHSQSVDRTACTSMHADEHITAER